MDGFNTKPGVPGRAHVSSFLRFRLVDLQASGIFYSALNILVRAETISNQIATCFHAGILLSLFFNPENGCDMFFRNVDSLSTVYTALHPRG
jgi:hypothetical protein